MLANLAGAVPDVLEEAAPLIIAECEAALEALGSGLAGDCATFIQWMGVIRHSEDGLVRFAKHVCRVQDAPEASQNRRALGWSDAVETIQAPAPGHWGGHLTGGATLRSGAGSARETSALTLINVSTASGYAMHRTVRGCTRANGGWWVAGTGAAGCRAPMRGKR